MLIEIEMKGKKIGLASNNFIKTKSVSTFAELMKTKKTMSWTHAILAQLIIRYLLDYNWRVANRINI